MAPVSTIRDEYCSASTLTEVQVQIQRDLPNTATWTKDHGMAAHPEKTKYMIINIGTQQKLSHCEECALLLCLDDRRLEQTQDEHLLELDIDPSLSWSSQEENLKKKLLKDVALLARIKNSYQSNIALYIFLC